ncbi:MAG: GABA permease, partial [Solirubrobacteraceae bacterium]
YGTVAIFVYVLIAAAELTLRRRLERDSPDRLRVRMWGYPYLTILAIVAMLAIVSAMAFIPGLRYSLLFGVLSAAAMVVGYALRNLARSRKLSGSISTDGPR